MRSSVLRLVVCAVAVLSGAGCDLILSPSPTDDNWRLSSAGRFTFYVRPGSFAEANVGTFATVLEDQFATSVARLDLRYQGHVTVFLHNSGADAGFSADLGDGDHSGVAYPETETVKAACVPPLDGNLMSLLSHEVNHVIIRNGLGRPGTSFVNEGLASAVLSERYHALGKTFYYRWTAERGSQLPRLADLVDDDKWQSRPQNVSYSASASFLAYAIETYGLAPLKAVYGVNSREFAGRFQSAYGRSLDEAEAEWLAFCQRQGR